MADIEHAYYQVPLDFAVAQPVTRVCVSKVGAVSVLLFVVMFIFSYPHSSVESTSLIALQPFLRSNSRDVPRVPSASSFGPHIIMGTGTGTGVPAFGPASPARAASSGAGWGLPWRMRMEPVVHGVRPSRAFRAAAGGGPPTVIAVIADETHPFGDTLKTLAKNTPDGEFLIANSADDFVTKYGDAKVATVQVIVPAVFANGKASVVADLWSKCPVVTWVHALSAGMDAITPILSPLDRISTIPVTNAKGAFSRSLAEYSLMAMLHFNKQVPRVQENKKTKTWEKFIMPELHGKTVGFVGFGDIAQTTAALCKAFGMRIFALRRSKAGASPKAEADEVFTYDDASGRTEFFRKSDYVVCSLPGTTETYHFCGKEEFGTMPPSSVFISVGRGTAVDEAALSAELKSGGIAGAALDVYEKEPLDQSSPLWDTPNLLMTSHNADLVDTYIEDSWSVFDKKLKMFRADPETFATTVERVSLELGY